MSTEIDADGELADRGKWGGDVVEARTTAVEWGTHTFEIHVQRFEDGAGHLEVEAPSDPPPAADEIVADALAGEWAVPEVGLILADAWGIQADQFRGDQPEDTP